MSTTNNLALTLIETNQSQKEVTANAVFAGIDAAVCDSAAVSVGDGANTVSAATARGAQHLLLSDGSPAPTAAFDVVLPAIKRLLIITNATSFDATVACTGAGTGAAEATVAAGSTRLVYCDGTQVFGMSAEPSGGAPYDIGTFCAGKPSASEVLLRFVAARAFTLPASLTGSQVKAGTAATGATNFDVQKNAVSIGTISFAASGTTATFTFASSASFAAGDVLAIVAPATADATLADISFTLSGTRS